MEDERLEQLFFSQLITFSSKMDELLAANNYNFTLLREKENEFYEQKMFVEKKVKNEKIRELYGNYNERLPKSIERKMTFLLVVRFLMFIFFPGLIFWGLYAMAIKKHKDKIKNHLKSMSDIAKTVISIYQNVGF